MHNRGDVLVILKDDYVSHIQGKVLTIIESMGLPSAQEQATKSLIKSALWDELIDYSYPVKEEAFTEFLGAQGFPVT